MAGSARQSAARVPGAPDATGVALVARDGSEQDVARIVHGLRRIVKALEVYSKEVQRAYGLTGPQLWALKVLARKGPLAAGALAQVLVVHQSSLSALLHRLEARGLVRRSRDRADRRVVRVALTPRGVTLAERAPEAAQGRLLHALRRMPAGERERIDAAVARLVGAMEAHDIDARFFFADE
ncbi:MAG TPA: MarR family transcriptional regulator [Gemmatimonadales bacterium]|nr:MarR family transcriptional regulator [Gemmatimonadales bacterium]